MMRLIEIIDYLIYTLQNQIVIWEIDMEKADGTPLYWLGSAIGQLLTVLESPMSGYLTGNATLARHNLEFFINQTESLPLSRIAAMQVLNNLNDIITAKPQTVAIAPPLTKEEKGPLTGIPTVTYLSISVDHIRS